MSFNEPELCEHERECHEQSSFCKIDLADRRLNRCAWCSRRAVLGRSRETWPVECTIGTFRRRAIRKEPLAGDAITGVVTGPYIRARRQTAGLGHDRPIQSQHITRIFTLARHGIATRFKRSARDPHQTLHHAIHSFRRQGSFVSLRVTWQQCRATRW